MIIAWTYLLHAYYRSKKIEYRYCKTHGLRKRYDRTRRGAYKYWELERCIDEQQSPIDRDTSNNLRFLIGLRHEIEHQMTSRIDDLLSARFQVCCLNYNQYIKLLFGEKLGIEKHLSFSLQFSTISSEQKKLLEDHRELPDNIQKYILDFDGSLSNDEYGSPKYAYRILFVQKTANRRGQADHVIEFIKSDSPLADTVNKQYAVIKETEKQKYLPKQIAGMMQDEGFPNFKVHHHTELWQKHDAKRLEKGYGTMVAGKQWHWYRRWVDVVRKHCHQNPQLYA